MLLEEGVLVVYVHPHRGLAGNDGGSRDLWPGREVTQRLIYFTGVPLPPFFFASLSLSLSRSSSRIHDQHHGASPWGTVRGPRGASSRHCATYTTGQPPLHAATSYLHEKGVDPLPPPSSFSTPFHPRIQRLVPRPRYDPSQGAPRCSLQCKHGSSLSPGSLYFKGHGARLFTLVPRHFGHDPPPPLLSYSLIFIRGYTRE